MTRIRVLHREVELTVPVVLIQGEKTSPLLNQRDGKIDRSAEALRVRHHPFHLSLRNYQPVMERRASNCADRNAGNGNFMSLRGALVPGTCTRSKCATKQSHRFDFDTLRSAW